MLTSSHASQRSTSVLALCAIAALGFVLSFSSPSALAASQCKGKSQTMCGASDSCSWVKSYVTKKGSKVSAFCRAKPGKSKKVSGDSRSSSKTSSASSSSSANSSKKASTKSSKKKSQSKKKSSSDKAAKSKSSKSESSKKKPKKKKSKKKKSSKKSSK